MQGLSPVFAMLTAWRDSSGKHSLRIDVAQSAVILVAPVIPRSSPGHPPVNRGQGCWCCNVESVDHRVMPCCKTAKVISRQMVRPFLPSFTSDGAWNYYSP